MNVLSVFDGMSCGQIALERVGLEVEKYYACEIEKKSIKVARHNYPNMISLGDITTTFYTSTGFELKSEDSCFEVPNSNDIIDLVIGGSPCQDISLLNKIQNGLDGDKSSLFFHYLRLLNECRKRNPNVYFLLENVMGSKAAVKAITKIMGVRPMRFNSNMVSAQNRKRLYWTNIQVTSLPKKKRLVLTDILEKNVDERYFLKDGRLNWLTGESGRNSQEKRFSALDPELANCLTKRGEGSWNCNYVTDNGRIRKLTPVEWERIQTVPDNYTAVVDDKYRYEMLGNGWTVDIIAHILKHLPAKFQASAKKIMNYN